MPSPGRTIAIGDIHGCSRALETLLAAVNPGPSDTVVTLGDLIDRGPDTRGVIDRLIDLRSSGRLIPVLGNHEQMLLDVLAGRLDAFYWLYCGGEAVLSSYGIVSPSEIPDAHLTFLGEGRNYFETETHFFTHASYDPVLPLGEQPEELLRWSSLRDRIPGPHHSGKVAVVGHTAQRSGEVLDLGHLICLDTYCYGGRWLTAIDLDGSRLWQANQHGELRHAQGVPLSSNPSAGPSSSATQAKSQSNQ